MKKLFDKQDHYAPDGLKFEDEIIKVIRPIMMKWFDDGYSIRDLANLVNLAASSEANLLILERDSKEAKKRMSHRKAMFGK